MIILDEIQYAKKRLDEGTLNDNPYYDISMIAKYFYYDRHKSKEEIYNLLIDFLKDHFKPYDYNSYHWQETVRKIISNVDNRKPLQISGVKITKSEMQKIIGINNKVLERLMFTMLCLAKYSNAKNPSNNGWVSFETNKIYKLARIQCSAIEKDIKIGRLWQLGMLEFSKDQRNLNCRVTIINDDDDEELFVSDFRELGYEYMNYRNGGFIRCAECDILTRANKNGTKRYCEKCVSYSPIGYRMVVCADCGNMIQVSSANKRAIRCQDCQKKHRLEYQKAWDQQNR